MKYRRLGDMRSFRGREGGRERRFSPDKDWMDRGRFLEGRGLDAGGCWMC